MSTEYPKRIIITAFTKKQFGIGKNGQLPWKLTPDLKYFKDMTEGHIVVMGRKTYDSIPEKNRPLKNRINIILTECPNKYKSNEQVIYVNFAEINSFVNNLSLKLNKTVFIIGGYTLYNHFMGYAESIMATVIENDFECDTFFPTKHFDKYQIESYSDVQEFENIKYRFITYEKINKEHGEYQYLNLIKDVMENGDNKPDRTGIGTKSVFGRQIRFSIEKTLPLITTKFVGIKSIIAELLWFLKGQTDSKILEKQNVNIWRANTTREFLDNRGLTEYTIGDIGSMYGFIWRRFGAKYLGCDEDYTNKGIDQLELLIKGLKEDPYSRRHIITTYNPEMADQGVLLPCHGLTTQFNCQKIENKIYLSCHMYQRSVDIALGLPYNIASYAILTHIIAKKCDMIPKDLIISCSDTHIYNNVYEQLKLQITRSPLPFPILELDESIKNTSFDDLSQDQFKLIGYLHHPSIKMEMAV